MNTEPEVVGTHCGVNLCPIPGHPVYLASKCGQIYSTKLGGWKRTQNTKTGYKRVSITDPLGAQKTIKVHRLIGLAFLDVNGLEVDHINRIKSDNRSCNLRAVSRAENMRNQVGKGFQRTKYGWSVRVKHNGRSICIGTYGSEKEAHEAYLSKKRELSHLPV